MARGFHAADRAVLRISGADHAKFLQDLVTSDLGGLKTGAVYAALLSPQGKYLFDFLMVADPGGPQGAGGGDGVLIDVAAARAEALAQRLAMYRLRAKVEIAQTDLGVVVLLDGPGADAGGPDAGAAATGRLGIEGPDAGGPDVGQADAGQTDAGKPHAGRAVEFADPRDPALGWRVLTADPQGLAARLDPVPAEAWTALRIARGVPETGIELVPEESYILEAGFDRLAGVDFRKGCYVGQEVTARMRHKTELRKGLLRVGVDGPAPAPGTAILRDGKTVGTLYSTARGEGLAHLRFDRAGPGMRAGEAQISLRDPLPAPARAEAPAADPVSRT